MNIVNTETTTYDIGDGFRMDVVKDGIHFDGWIYHEDYGIKSHMFGITADNVRDFLAIVDVDPYIDLYQEEYMD